VVENRLVPNQKGHKVRDSRVSQSRHCVQRAANRVSRLVRVLCVSWVLLESPCGSSRRNLCEPKCCPVCRKSAQARKGNPVANASSQLSCARAMWGASMQCAGDDSPTRRPRWGIERAAVRAWQTLFSVFPFLVSRHPRLPGCQSAAPPTGIPHPPAATMQEAATWNLKNCKSAPCPLSAAGPGKGGLWTAVLSGCARSPQVPAVPFPHAMPASIHPCPPCPPCCMSLSPAIPTRDSTSDSPLPHVASAAGLTPVESRLRVASLESTMPVPLGP